MLKTLLYKQATENGEGILAKACYSKNVFKENVYNVFLCYLKYFFTNLTFIVIFILTLSI